MTLLETHGFHVLGFFYSFDFLFSVLANSYLMLVQILKSQPWLTVIWLTSLQALAQPCNSLAKFQSNMVGTLNIAETLNRSLQAHYKESQENKEIFAIFENFKFHVTIKAN